MRDTHFILLIYPPTPAYTITHSPTQPITHFLHSWQSLHSLHSLHPLHSSWTKMLVLEPLIRKHWNLEKFLGGSIGQKTAHTTTVQKINETIRSQKFWACARIVQEVGFQAEIVGRWSEGCSCHQSHQELYNFVRHSGRGIGINRYQHSSSTDVRTQRGACSRAGDRHCNQDLRWFVPGMQSQHLGVCAWAWPENTARPKGWLGSSQGQDHDRDDAEAGSVELSTKSSLWFCTPRSLCSSSLRKACFTSVGAAVSKLFACTVTALLGSELVWFGQRWDSSPTYCDLAFFWPPARWWYLDFSKGATTFWSSYIQSIYYIIIISLYLISYIHIYLNHIDR